MLGRSQGLLACRRGSESDSGCTGDSVAGVVDVSKTTLLAPPAFSNQPHGAHPDKHNLNHADCVHARTAHAFDAAAKGDAESIDHHAIHHIAHAILGRTSSHR